MKYFFSSKNNISRTVAYCLVPAVALLPLINFFQLLADKWDISQNLSISLTTFFIIFLLCVTVSFTIYIIYPIEKKLRRSESLSRLLIENRKDYAVFLLDPVGNITSWNKSAEHLTGFNANQVIGQSCTMLFTEQEKKGNKPDALLQLSLQNKQAELEGWRVAKNGSYFWANITIAALFDENNELTGFNYLMRNATQRKDAEVKLGLLLDAAPDAMLVMDREGEIILANTQTKKVFGYSFDELLGKSFYALFPKCYRKEYKKTIEDYITHFNEKLSQKRLEMICYRKDTGEFSGEVSIRIIETSRGLLLAVAIRDMTLHKKNEEKLQNLVEKLENSNRELERFAYIASHDLQEPLRMVSSYTQLLAKKYKDKLDAEANEFIDFAVDGAVRMQQLITDLLNYSRVTTKGKPFALTHSEIALKQAMQNLSVLIKETGAQITYDYLPEVLVDDVQLMQLFQNLIGNAIKFNDKKPLKVHISATKQNNVWVFTVADNGIGIDPQFHDQVFLIFRRLHGKKDYEGTGMGLAICEKIVKRHGGRIWVESESGKGAKFHFTIPGQTI